MPTIRPYQQQVSPEIGLTGRNAQASDLGHTGFTQLGNSVQSATQDAAQATAIIERNRARQEATDADLNATLASVTLTEKLQAREKAWKPGDLPLIGEAAAEIQRTLDGMKYREDGSEKYETELGRTTFAQRSAHLAAQYLQEASRAQSRLDGVAAVAQFNTLTSAKANFLATGVNYLHLESSLKEYEQSLHTGIYENLPNEKRAELFRMGKSVLAENAMEGMIRDNPKGAMTALQSGFMADTLDDGKVGALLDKARVAEHGLKSAASHAEADRRYQEELAERSSLSTLVSQYAAHKLDPKQPNLTVDAINKSFLMDKDPAKALELIKMLDQDVKERQTPIKGDPAVYLQLYRDIAAGRMKDLSPINRARGNAQVTAEQHEELRKEWEGATTPEGKNLLKEADEFFKRAEPAIMPKDLTGVLADPESGFRMMKYQHDVRTEMDKDRKAGKDPFKRLDPDAPEYMGKPEIVKRYISPFLERIQAASKRLSEQPGLPKTPEGAVPDPMKRQPGESSDAYLKRIGK